MIRRVHDLHPDDTAARITLRHQLRDLRRQLGVHVDDLADACGTTFKAIYLFEQRGNNPLAATVQRYAGGLGHQIVMRPMLTPELREHPDAAALAALAAATHNPALADAYQRSAVLTNLVAHRRWLNMSARDIAERCGLHRAGGWISQFENDQKPALLATYQRYTRALGGHLNLDLQPLNPHHLTEGAHP